MHRGLLTSLIALLLCCFGSMAGGATVDRLPVAPGVAAVAASVQVAADGTVQPVQAAEAERSMESPIESASDVSEAVPARHRSDMADEACRRVPARGPPKIDSAFLAALKRPPRALSFR